MLGHRKLILQDYVAILRRRWQLIALPTVLLPIVGFALSFLVSPEYLSQTLVLIEGQKVPDNYVKPVISSDLDSRLASMKEQILSRSRLQPIIERYNLYGAKGMSMDDRIDSARRSISIKPITSAIAHAGGLPGFFISFAAGDAHTAQLVCGDITSLFLNENLRAREASAEGTTAFLKSQLTDAKRSLDEQDAKLAEFQRKYMGRLPGEDSPNVNMLTSLNTQLEANTQALARLEQDKSYEEAMLSQQVQSLSASSSPAGPSLSRQGLQQELQALLAQEADLTTHYTAEHPDVMSVRRKIADVRKQMNAPAANSTSAASGAGRMEPEAIQQLRAQIRATETGIQAKRKEQAGIQASIHTYQDRISSSPLIAAEYKQLTRDYQTAQAFYDDLLSKMNQSKMATDLEKRQEGEQFRVMDEPNLPEEPTSPKRSVFAMGGLVAGLMLGLGISTLLEYKDTALRNERDVAAATDLPTLAIISLSREMGDQPSARVSWWQRLRSKGVPGTPTNVARVNG